MSIGNWAEAAMLDWLSGGASPTRPTTRNLGLHTADPTDTGTVGEIVGNGYARQAITWGAASGTSPTQVANTSTHTFTAAGGNWGTITHWSEWDNAGNFLWSGALTVSRVINDGESGTWAAGALIKTLD